jgi:hypothetical protein
MREFANQETLFKGKYMVVARVEKEITDRQTGQKSKYYEIGLSNGFKMLSVTCGEKHALSAIPFGQTYELEFTIEERRGANGALLQKLKVLDVVQAGSVVSKEEIEAVNRASAASTK